MNAAKSSKDLVRTEIFASQGDYKLSVEDRVKLSYQRARAVAKLHAPTIQDVVTLSPRFWAMLTDPILCLDAPVMMHLLLQYNLCVGIAAMFAPKTPSVQPMLQQLLDFDVIGQFCLTEVDHGLDAVNLETTATMLPDGDFILNTPHDGAAKYMSAVGPSGLPCVALVFARTFMRSEDHGVRPFLIPFHNGTELAPGVVCRLLPQPGGRNPINHCLIWFNQARIPSTALLRGVASSKDQRSAFQASVSRVAIGMLAICSFSASSLMLSSCIAARYSQRRTVLDAAGVHKPILSFQTQRIPILRALAEAFVLRASRDRAISDFCNRDIDPHVRQEIAVLSKVTAVMHARASKIELGDRCGAQGLFAINQIEVLHADLRGMAIAEGDILGISVRLASELLLGRYAVPPTAYPESLLARHEAGVLSQLRAQLAEIGNHRSAQYNSVLLPESVPLVQAIGQRYAYDAARAAGVDACLVDMYAASCARSDESWYVEHLGMTRAELRAMQARAVDALLPRLDEFLARMDIEDYVTAPIISVEKWDTFVKTLPIFPGPERSSNLGIHSGHQEAPIGEAAASGFPLRAAKL
ncbi:acyl-CoA dehydrogenase NM domain-like protein [Gloeopeniophorella convolvens]|nr:acyl-CoA dehydrogenase NM domain-like protein [Gloeopeniophorella convolvens]